MHGSRAIAWIALCNLDAPISCDRPQDVGNSGSTKLYHSSQRKNMAVRRCTAFVQERVNNSGYKG
jgi:hypothetical protein